MKPIVVKHFLYCGASEEHGFSDMSNALDFIHILHGEYPVEKIVIDFKV